MRTQIIQLEPHDDLISIRDRMSWAKTPRVLLAWPRKGRVEIRPLDLTLIQRHAKTLGLQLALVTKDREIKRFAALNGILVFSTTADAQKVKWIDAPEMKLRPRRINLNLRKARDQLFPPPTQWMQIPNVRLGIFAAGVLSMLILMLAFVPSAVIHIQPAIKTQSISLMINADPETKQVYLSGNIPARNIHVTVDGSQTIKATGKSDVPDQFAQGVVRFTNLTDESLQIPAGLIVQTLGDPSMKFTLQKDVKLIGGAGQIVDASVKAIDPGITGNVPADSIIAIEGELGSKIAVTNIDPLAGGTVRRRVTPSDADREKLRSELLEILSQSAHHQIEANLQKGDILFPATIQIINTLDEKFSPDAGGAGSQLTLSLRLEYQALYASQADLIELANGLLDASVQSGYIPIRDSIQYTAESALFSGPSGATNWKVNFTRQQRAEIDPHRVIWAARGLGAYSVSQSLMDRFALSQTPTVELSPSWWFWMPLIPMRIEVVN